MSTSKKNLAIQEAYRNARDREILRPVVIQLHLVHLHLAGIQDRKMTQKIVIGYDFVSSRRSTDVLNDRPR